MSRSADGSKIYAKIVNTDPTGAVGTRFDLRGVEVDPEASWHVLTAESFEVRNGFTTPDAIRPRRRAVPASESFELSLPARSVSVIVLRVAGS